MTVLAALSLRGVSMKRILLMIVIYPIGLLGAVLGLSWVALWTVVDELEWFYLRHVKG